MEISALLFSVIIGLAIGTVYALMGVGISLIYGVMKLFNLAHGELYMLAGYFMYFATTVFGIPSMAALPMAVAIGFVLGALTERLLVHDIHTKQIENRHSYTIILTLGFSMVLIHSSILLFGPIPKSVPGFIPGIYRFGEIVMSGDRLFALGTTIVIITSLFLFLRKTWTGRALQAVAQSEVGASVVGIDVPRFGTLAFAISGLLAAAAGALLSPLFHLSPTIGGVPLTKGWVIVVLGGLGSIPGSLLGGILLGVIEVLGSALIAPGYTDSYGFIALIIFLILRPQGIMGEKVRKA